MALREGDKLNFETLQKVFANGDQCLMECETVDGKYVAVVCATTRQEDGGFLVQPFARLFLGDIEDEIILPEGMEPK